jgi:hypothetical protein
VASIPDLVTQTTAFALILFSGVAAMTAEPASIETAAECDQSKQVHE